MTSHKNTVCYGSGTLQAFLDLFLYALKSAKPYCSHLVWCIHHKSTVVFVLLSNQPTWCTKSCFIIRLLNASTCFEHCVLIIRRTKLYYTASGIITPVGGRPVHRLREDARSANIKSGVCVMHHIHDGLEYRITCMYKILCKSGENGNQNLWMMSILDIFHWLQMMEWKQSCAIWWEQIENNH